MSVGNLNIWRPALLFPRLQRLNFRAQSASDMVLVRCSLTLLHFRGLDADSYTLFAEFLRVPSIRRSLKVLDISKFDIHGTSLPPNDSNGVTMKG